MICGEGKGWLELCSPQVGWSISKSERVYGGRELVTNISRPLRQCIADELVISTSCGESLVIIQDEGEVFFNLEFAEGDREKFSMSNAEIESAGKDPCVRCGETHRTFLGFSRYTTYLGRDPKDLQESYTSHLTFNHYCKSTASLSVEKLPNDIFSEDGFNPSSTCCNSM